MLAKARIKVIRNKVGAQVPFVLSPEERNENGFHANLRAKA
jgi:hypothetical protein